MKSDLRSRLTVLVVLAVLGVGLAIIGTAVGATTPLTASGGGAAFVVSEDNITFENGDQQATVLNNMTQVDSVEIEPQGSGTYQVNTKTDDPLTDRERSQAKTIARDNATVQEVLQNLNQYELSVDPIHKLNMDSAQTSSFSGLTDTSMDGETAEEEDTFTLSVKDSDESGTVTINRDPKYVEREAVVRVRDPATDKIEFSVTVDFANKTVTDITEWDFN